MPRFLLEPCLSITPEPLDPVDVEFSLRNAILFGYRVVCPAQTKTGVSSILTGVIQAAVVGVVNSKLFDFFAASRGEMSRHSHSARRLEYDGFSFGTATLGPSPESTERDFIKLKVTVQALGLGQKV